jgi:septal ring factor EnvC (AmiA/AmiB activator)
MSSKIAVVLFILLVSVTSGSAWYIDRLLDQISQLKANAQILETEIAEQNADIEGLIADAKKTQDTVIELQKKNQEAQKEVSKLRQTFARHDMNDLALNKPKLIEKSVNKGTKRVKEDFLKLTDPEQFDEKPDNDK